MWLTILNGVGIFLSAVVSAWKLWKITGPAPDDKHQGEADKIRKEQDGFKDTGRPQ